MDGTVTFDEFKEQWLEDILDGQPSTSELGRRFAHKIITQWRDIGDPSDDLVYTDGPGDGGIDIAYLERGESLEENSSEEKERYADTWYLVQSKYGSSFVGSRTLLAEGQKVISTLSSGEDIKVSGLTKDVLARIQQFRRNVDPTKHEDRIVLVFATERPLTPDENKALDDLRLIGQKHLGAIFDVEAVSLETIYRNTLDDMAAADQSK